MTSISQSEFSNRISQYQTIADKVTSSTQTDSIDNVVSRFASTILENGQYIKSDNPQFAHTLNQLKQLSDERCSPEVRAKMNEAFERVFNSRTEKFEEGMDNLLHNLPSRDAASFAEIHTEHGIPAAVQQLKEVLKDPMTLLDFITHGDKQFVSDMLFLLDININMTNSSGNTFLHLIAGSKDGAKAIKALADHGAKLDAVNGKNQLPIEIAIEANHLPTIKAFVRAGAKIPLNSPLLSSGKLSGEVVVYLAKQGIKQAAANLPKADAAISPPPSKPTPLGPLQGMLGHAALGVGFLPEKPPIAADYLPESLTPVKAIIPLLKGAELGIETKKEKQSNAALEGKINSLRERIDELDIKISGAKEPVKSTLIKEKKGLESDVRMLEALGSSEARNAEMEVYKKAIALQQGAQTAGSALFGLPKEGLMAQVAKATTNAAGVLSTAYTVFQNINSIQDMGERRERLQDVKTSLNSAYSELNLLYQQIPDKNSAGGVLLDMKMRGIYEQSQKVENEIDKLSSQIKLQGVATAGVAATGMMMAFSLYQYSTRIMSGDASVGVNLVVDNAATIGTVVGMLPSVLPTVNLGAGWLWSKGAAALTKIRGGEQPVEQDAPYRVSNHDAKQMQSEKKRLEAELSQIEKDFEGYPIAFGVWEKPEPGSAEHTRLTQRFNAIDERLGQIGRDLRQWDRHEALNKEDETRLLKEKSKLEASLDKVNDELHVGYPIAFGVWEKPEPGSTEHTQLTRQAAALDAEISRIDRDLKEHADAKSLGMTRAEFNEKFGALKVALTNPGSSEVLISIMKANGITEDKINEDPDGSLMEYLTK